MHSGSRPSITKARYSKLLFTEGNSKWQWLMRAALSVVRRVLPMNNWNKVSSMVDSFSASEGSFGLLVLECWKG